MPEVTTGSMRTAGVSSLSDITALLDHDDGAQHVSAVHLLERRLDVAQPDPLGDERVEVEPALTIEVDQHREVAAGQAVAVPARLQRAAPPEHLDERQLGHLHLRGGHAHQDHRAGEIPCEESLFVRLRPADRVDHHVRAEATGELADLLHGVVLGAVDGVRGAKLAGLLELPVVDVDGDDRRGARDACPGDRRVADPAAADDRDRVAPVDLAGVDRRAEPGHHAAPEQPDGGRLGVGVDLGALPRRDQRLLREGADAQRGAELGAVGEGHLLVGVVRVEAVPRLALGARAALTAHRAPVENHEVAGRDLGDALADRLDRAGGLVAEQEREVVADAAHAVVQVGVAHPARLDRHHRLARPRVGHHDVDQLDGRPLLAGDDSLDGLRHGGSSRFANR
ncbi:hypothetical protein GCM10025872_31260 [Barrientosiimonas endolithica]|uniref:Uncharacterized protein n=1 Tax=Barrientosiimonas endolithica TaxID=1535208 RepID=A0ABN6YR50_9MICO|nr:hypothetical protein GCM10025872_31260 [Barrientosiimonas endolithica]